MQDVLCAEINYVRGGLDSAAESVKLQVDIIELIVNGGAAGLRDWDRMPVSMAQIGRCVEDSVSLIMVVIVIKLGRGKIRAGHVSVVSS